MMHCHLKPFAAMAFQRYKLNAAAATAVGNDRTVGVFGFGRPTVTDKNCNFHDSFSEFSIDRSEPNLAKTQGNQIWR